MYGYKEYIPLTTEEILKRVKQEDIFSIVIKQPIILDKKVLYKAPYREDNNAGCYFEEYNNKIYFIDFADIDKRPKDCINFLGRVLKLDYFETIDYINSYFKLGLGNSNMIIKEVLDNQYNQKKKLEIFPKHKRFIQYVSRDFNNKDKQFWSSYGISRENLIEDKVVPIDLYRSVTRKGEIFTVRPLDISYAYTDFDDKKVKIYRPYGKKEEKWFTNCNQDDIGSINSLPWVGDLLIISKSYKDCRVIKNQGLNAIWFQNEGMLPNANIIKSLCKRFERIIVWFDNDQAGLANGKIVVDYINSIKPGIASLLFLPLKLLKEGVKDPSDLIKNKGIDELIAFLQSKKL